MPELIHKPTWEVPIPAPPGVMAWDSLGGYVTFDGVEYGPFRTEREALRYIKLVEREKALAS